MNDFHVIFSEVFLPPNLASREVLLSEEPLKGVVICADFKSSAKKVDTPLLSCMNYRQKLLLMGWIVHFCCRHLPGLIGHGARLFPSRALAEYGSNPSTACIRSDINGIQGFIVNGLKARERGDDGLDACKGGPVFCSPDKWGSLSLLGSKRGEGSCEICKKLDELLQILNKSKE